MVIYGRDVRLGLAIIFFFVLYAVFHQHYYSKAKLQ